MNKKYLISAIIVLLIILAALGLIFLGGEDNWVCQNGEWVKRGNPSGPTPSGNCSPQATPTPTSTPEKNVTMESPKSGDRLTLPFSITGQARTFESQVSIKVKDAQGNTLFEGFTMAQSPDIGLFGPYKKDIIYLYQKPASQDVFVDSFEYSAKDGSVINLVSTPVKLNTDETRTIKVFYSNNNLDPQISCNKVFPVDRIISKSGSLIENTLKALLGEMNRVDVEKEYDTNINQGTFVKSWSLKDGVARVDFNDILELNAGGSCRVSAIRAQITETLKQFPTVQEVIISIDGKSEDILQP